MYNLENKKNNYLNLFDGFDDLFNGMLEKDMKTNIVENDDNYIITSEIPGVLKEQVNINVEDSTLTIKVNKQDVKEEKKNYIVKERVEKEVSRSFYLDNMNEDEIEAKMDNGILTIKVNKLKDIKPKQKTITIE